MLMLQFATNKWERKKLRQKIDDKRAIGQYLRKKQNKTCNKHKLKKRRRSKRRNLIKTINDNALQYIMDNPCNPSIIEWNNYPILSPKNYDIGNNQIGYDLQTFKINTNNNNKQLLCIICNKYYHKKAINNLNCNLCKEYVTQNNKYRLKVNKTVCNKCAISIDLCTSWRESVFCKIYAIKHSCINHSSSISWINGEPYCKVFDFIIYNIESIPNDKSINKIRNGQYGKIGTDKIDRKMQENIDRIIKEICHFIILHGVNEFESIFKWLKDDKLREHMISLGFPAKLYSINKIYKGEYGQITADKIKKMLENEYTYIKKLNVYLDKLNNTFNQNEKYKDGDYKELMYDDIYGRVFTADSIISNYVNNEITKSDFEEGKRIYVKYRDSYDYEKYYLQFPPKQNEYFDEYDGIIIDLNQALQVLCYQFISNQYRNKAIIPHDICNLICKYYKLCDNHKRLKMVGNKLPFLIKYRFKWEHHRIHPKHLKCKTLDIFKNSWIWSINHVINCFTHKCIHCLGYGLHSVYLYQWVDYYCDDKRWYEAQVIEINECYNNKITITTDCYYAYKHNIDLNEERNKVYPLHTFTKRGKSIGNVQCEIGIKCYYNKWYVAEIIGMNENMLHLQLPYKEQWINNDSYRIAPIIELKSIYLNQWIDFYYGEYCKWYKAQIIEIDGCDKNQIKVRRGRYYKEEVIDLNKESYKIAPLHTFTKYD